MRTELYAHVQISLQKYKDQSTNMHNLVTAIIDIFKTDGSCARGVFVNFIVVSHLISMGVSGTNLQIYKIHFVSI